MDGRSQLPNGNHSSGVISRQLDCYTVLSWWMEDHSCLMATIAQGHQQTARLLHSPILMDGGSQLPNGHHSSGVISRQLDCYTVLSWWMEDHSCLMATIAQGHQQTARLLHSPILMDGGSQLPNGHHSSGVISRQLNCYTVLSWWMEDHSCLMATIAQGHQ